MIGISTPPSPLQQLADEHIPVGEKHLPLTTDCSISISNFWARCLLACTRTRINPTYDILYGSLQVNVDLLFSWYTCAESVLVSAIQQFSTGTVGSFARTIRSSSASETISCLVAHKILLYNWEHTVNTQTHRPCVVRNKQAIVLCFQVLTEPDSGILDMIVICKDLRQASGNRYQY